VVGSVEVADLAVVGSEAGVDSVAADSGAADSGVAGSVVVGSGVADLVVEGLGVAAPDLEVAEVVLVAEDSVAECLRRIRLRVD
jgi:NO-binding membrane sensor protein with MHYT domain